MLAQGRGREPVSQKELKDLRQGGGRLYRELGKSSTLFLVLQVVIVVIEV